MENGTEDHKDVLRDFIKNNFIYTTNGIDLKDDSSLMEMGVIDSTGVLELIEFIEEKFQITIENHEIIPENLDSINNMGRFIENKSNSME